MREIPILFNGDMVKAILDGNKAQTRRPLKPQPDTTYWKESAFAKPKEWRKPAALGPSHIYDGNVWVLHNVGDPVDAVGYTERKFPFGVEGDIFWVRETFHYWSIGAGAGVIYKADQESDYEGPWTPSIHMPRRISRISLRVKRVWVERLQDISEEDAWKEGVKGRGITRYQGESIDLFKGVWDSIYDKKGFGWNTNPWVACCEFEIEENL